MKRIVLLGGGHVHAPVLLHFRQSRPRGMDLKLVTPERREPYSGMVPGYLAGHYSREEIEIDVERLAARAGAEFIVARAAALDPERSLVRLEDGRELAYDVVSLDVGSAQRPYSGLLEGELKGKRAAVIGAGPAGAELAMALAFRGLAVALYGDVAPDRRILAALGRNRVDFRLAAVPKDTKQDFDVTVVATGPAPQAWLRASGLALDAQGFVLVDETLRSVSHTSVLAVGDCATSRLHPHPKSGVYAVRQAPVLGRNLAALAGGGRLERYMPQAKSLTLISCGGKYAIARRGAWSAEGAWLWRVKDAIDRRWVARFS